MARPISRHEIGVSVADVPAVRLRGVVALLGRFPALAGADLDVDRAEVVVLQGPNGAGKTTLLRLCAGLVPVHDGEAEVLGHDLRLDRNGVRAHVGLVGPGTGLFDDLTVADNVGFFARACGAPVSAVAEAMTLLALDGRLADAPVARLSTGQRRRAALASIVVRRPQLWLLDEPHAGLDQDGRDVVDRVILDAAAAGATVIVASHELERVQALAARTVTVAGGLVLAGIGAGRAR